MRRCRGCHDWLRDEATCQSCVEDRIKHIQIIKSHPENRCWMCDNK